MPLFSKIWKTSSFTGKDERGKLTQRSPSALRYQAVGNNQIRLVQLLPGLDDTIIELTILPPVNLGTLPPYQALSYTWGDANITKLVRINDVDVQVTENLAAFLQYHRRHLAQKKGTLWIDAICIDQVNTDEKNVQISYMRQVYEQAQSTIVWLGTERPECKKGLELIDKMPYISPSMEDPTQAGLDLSPWLEDDINKKLVKDCWLSFTHLIMLPWFTRVWVKQEYIVSSTIELQLGNRFLSLQELYPAGFFLPPAKGFQEILLEITKEHPTEAWRARQSLVSMYQVEALVTGRIMRFDPSDGVYSARPLIHYLWKFRDNNATDPRDRVYGLLGLLEPANKPTGSQSLEILGYDSRMLIIDYQAPLNLVYASIVKAIVVVTKSLNILCACQGSSIQKLPTWTPDWTVPWRGTSLLQHKIRLYGTRGVGADFAASKYSESVFKFSNNLESLQVRGIIVDSIDNVWPSLIRKIKNVDIYQPALMEAYRLKVLQQRRQGPGIYQNTETAHQAHWYSLTATLDAAGVNGRGNTFPAWATDFSDWILNSTVHTHLMQCFLGTLRGRRTIISKLGYFIAGPDSSKAKDLICILLGCDVPVILRKDSNGFKFIGECFCYGIMKGEIMEALDAGEAKLTDFTLY